MGTQQFDARFAARLHGTGQLTGQRGRRSADVVPLGKVDVEEAYGILTALPNGVVPNMPTRVAQAFQFVTIWSSNAGCAVATFVSSVGSLLKS